MVDSRRTVERIVERDPVIKKGLQRGIINSRALARYIQRVDGIDVSADAILGIIRRYALTEEDTQDIRFTREDCEITMRSRVGELALEKAPDTMRKISEFAASIKSTKGQNLRVLAGTRDIRLTADQKSLDEFKEGLLDKEVLSFTKDLVEISLLTPEAEHTKEIYAAIASELALNDVDLVGVWCAAPEAILMVKEKDSLRALEALQRMLAESPNGSVSRKSNGEGPNYRRSYASDSA